MRLLCRGPLLLALMLFAGFSLAGGQAEAASSNYIDFDRYQSARQLSAGTADRVVVRNNGTVVLGSSPRQGTDRTGFYNGGRYFYGTLTSRAYGTDVNFDTLVPSWNARTSAGTWVQLEVRVRSGGQWTRWWNMGVWASGNQEIRRHSVNGQSTPRWAVSTDTLQSKGRIFANAYQYRLRLFAAKRGTTPVVRNLSFVTSNSYRHGENLGIPALKQAWGRNLNVPARSQMIYPNGGEVWCSPTSLSMVMAYWANRTGNKHWNRTVPAVASATYDHAYRGNGNWPFNVAYASSLGLKGSVSRFSQIEQVERWIDMGIPVIASIAWNNNYSGQRLSGAPLPASSGHLLVIRGFTRNGDVIVNDPAGREDSQVRRVYSRGEFSRAWLRNGSGGVVYLVHPGSWKTPYPYASRGSW